MTKTYFSVSLLTFIFLYLNIWITMEDVYLDMERVQEMQIWRVLTALVYENGQSVLVYALKFYISYTILVNLEENVYGRQSSKIYAQFIWLMLIVFTFVTFLTMIFDFYITNHLFFLCLCNVWHYRQPNSSQKVFFGVTIPSNHI